MKIYKNQFKNTFQTQTTTMKQVVLASQNPAQIAAVTNVFNPYVYELKTYTTTNPKTQPLGFEEIETGTKNRLESCDNKQPDTYYVAFETGILNHTGSCYPGNHYYQVTCVTLLYVKDLEFNYNKAVTSWSTMIPISNPCQELKENIPILTQALQTVYETLEFNLNHLKNSNHKS